MGYYFTIKRNEILIHATTWISLDNTSTKGSQAQKTAHNMIPFNEMLVTGKSIETKYHILPCVMCTLAQILRENKDAHYTWVVLILYLYKCF